MKKKLNLFFHNIDFCSVQRCKIPWNCIYLKISFEKFSIGSPRSLAFNAVFCREIIVVQSCNRALHILYGKLSIHNSDNTLDLLYDIFALHILIT